MVETEHRSQVHSLRTSEGTAGTDQTEEGAETSQSGDCRIRQRVMPEPLEKNGKPLLLPIPKADTGRQHLRQTWGSMQHAGRRISVGYRSQQSSRTG